MQNLGNSSKLGLGEITHKIVHTGTGGNKTYKLASPAAAGGWDRGEIYIINRPTGPGKENPDSEKLRMKTGSRLGIYL